MNYAWAPLIDKFRPVGLAPVGRRKSWIILCQVCIAMACFIIGRFNPEYQAKLVVLIGLSIAILSATQDIAIDAYRIERFPQGDKKGISAGAAATTAGWWTGYAGVGFLPLALSDHGWSWPELYILMGGICVAFAGITYFLPETNAYTQDRSLEDLSKSKLPAKSLVLHSRTEKATFVARLLCIWLLPVWAVIGSPGAPEGLSTNRFYVPGLMLIVMVQAILFVRALSKALDRSKTQGSSPEPLSLIDKLLASLVETLIIPLMDFFNRNGQKLALGILAFVLLFKLGEAFVGRMSIIFYKDIGYSNSDIGTYSKMITWWVTIGFVIPCGILNARFGILKGLFISGVAMASTNLMFSWIAISGPKIDLLIAAVIIDGFTQAWGTVAFVAFISSLCNQAFSATQYALLASLSTLGRTTIAANSGLLIDGLSGNWALFFIITTLMVIPGLSVLLILWKRLEKILKEGSGELK